MNPVQQWLRSVLGPYANRDLVYAHVDAVLAAYASLSPRTASYTHDDGRTQILLCLHGTLPIAFKSKSYNIPVALWIPYNYPASPPITYVTPTSNMLVRPSASVDVSGRCAGDYLTSWTRKPEGRNLVDLAHFQQALFAREPPVYAKPPSVPSPVSPPIPSSSLSSPSITAASPVRSPAPRPAPRPPSLPDTPPVPQRPGSATSTTSATHHTSPSVPSRPPLPPVPSSGGSASRLTKSLLPQPNDLRYAAQPISGRSPPLPVPPRQTVPPAALPYPPPRPEPQNPARLQSPPNPSKSLAAVENILDAPETDASAAPEAVPTPLRPTNPGLVALRSAVHAKLASAFASREEEHRNECAQLEALHRDLAQGVPAVADEMARLETVKGLCAHIGERYQGVVEQARANIEAARAKEVGQVDDLLCSTTVVYNQLIDLIAEDNAIEDTIYQLGRGLNNETARIDLDKFLKRVRSLAREQFVKRATINKILLEMAMA